MPQTTTFVVVQMTNKPVGRLDTAFRASIELPLQGPLLVDTPSHLLPACLLYTSRCV